MIQQYTPIITKEEIAQLPIELFNGRIFTINSVTEADKAVDYLKGFSGLNVSK